MKTAAYLQRTNNNGFRRKQGHIIYILYGPYNLII